MPIATQQVAEAHLSVGVDESLLHLHEQYGLTGAGQTVVVIDSGIAYDHPALGQGFGPSSHVVGGWDFTDENDADPYDDAPAGFHGTHVAGIIGSLDPQHMGLAPGADLIGLRVFDDYGHSDFEWIERALRWVHEHRDSYAQPITTVNLSIGLMPTARWNNGLRVLEDEFAQLVADGIFISVAAGNGYDVQPDAGLSYPASSSWVVPVGSVGADGLLSRFSRRDTRMLVAPGENVNSTVTDYLFDFDGVTDDWHAFSGTSQAAPYVAGAAVLVRQAMERSGHSAADQEAIYQILRETANWIQDPISGQSYAQVDLAAAIESILPDVAVSRRVESTDFPAIPAGQVHDMGAVDWAELPVSQTTEMSQEFVFQAVHEGLLSVAATFDYTQSISLELFDDAGHRLARRTGKQGALQVEWPSIAGTRYSVRVSGAESEGRLTWANIGLEESSTRIRVEVPQDVEHVQVRHGSDMTLQMEGLRLNLPTFDGASLDLVVQPDDAVRVESWESGARAYVRPGRTEISGTAGLLRVLGSSTIDLDLRRADASQVRFYGSSGDERFVSHSGDADLQGDDLQFSARGYERIYVFSGGGNDRAELHGSPDDDLFVINSNEARLSNLHQLSFVEGFAEVSATAQGGVDRAFFYGTDHDDSFSASPDSARLASQGRLWYAQAFERVYATAGLGGLDRAFLHGSTGVDRFEATPSRSTLSSIDYLQSVTDFDRVFAYATPGDGDFAQLKGSASDDRFTASVTEVTLGNNQYVLGSVGFDQIDVHGGPGGRDTARLTGDGRDGRVDVGADGIRWLTADFRWRIAAFSSIDAFAGKGGFHYIVAPSVAGYNEATHEYQAPAFGLQAQGFNWLFRDAVTTLRSGPTD